MGEKDVVEEARDLVIRLGQDRKSAFCKAVTHKVIEAEAQNLINRLADEVQRLRMTVSHAIHRSHDYAPESCDGCADAERALSTKEAQQ